VHDVAAGLTDVLLGAVLIWCAIRIRAVAPGTHRYWTLTFWTAGAGAFAGTAHHLVFQWSDRAADLSWIAVGILVAVAISYLLAASAVELVDARLARWFIRIRIAGLVAYLVVISTFGIGRSGPLVISESVTMACIVGLWCYGLYIGHPRAKRMMVAIVGSAASAAALALPAVGTTTGLDGRSLQHLAQIPGVLLLMYAVTLEVPSRATARPRVEAG
jgi:hypothetical protein